MMLQYWVVLVGLSKQHLDDIPTRLKPNFLQILNDIKASIQRSRSNILIDVQKSTKSAFKK
jgi:hypothetical protein